MRQAAIARQAADGRHAAVPTPRATSPKARANRRAARRDAASLLTKLNLPAGATSVPSEPAHDHGYLAPQQLLEADFASETAHAWWTVPGDPQSVIDAIEARSAGGGDAGRDGQWWQLQDGHVRARRRPQPAAAPSHAAAGTGLTAPGYRTGLFGPFDIQLPRRPRSGRVAFAGSDEPRISCSGGAPGSRRDGGGAASRRRVPQPGGVQALRGPRGDDAAAPPRARGARGLPVSRRAQRRRLPRARVRRAGRRQDARGLGLSEARRRRPDHRADRDDPPAVGADRGGAGDGRAARRRRCGASGRRRPRPEARRDRDARCSTASIPNGRRA